MSPQADYICANGTGAAVRSDINGQLAAIVSNNSGATEPGTMYAYQWWADTTTGLLKQRNSANSAWITIGTLASTNLGLLSLTGGTMTGALAVTAGTAALPGIAVSGDLNTGITSPGADQLAISTGGTSRLAVSTTAVSSTLAVDVPLGAVGTPSITFTGDLNTGLFSPGADTLALVTSGTNRVHVTSGGLVGIGTTPVNKLDVSGSISATGSLNNTGYAPHIHIGLSGGNPCIASGNNVAATFLPLVFLQETTTASAERARIDASGRLLVGTSTARANFFNSATAPQFQIEGTGLGTTTASVTRCSADAFGPIVALGKSRNASVGGNTIVSSGDECGTLDFQGNDGTEFVSLATITGAVDGTPGANDMPGRLVFSTTADGAASPTERMRITNNGNILFGTTTENPGIANTVVGSSVNPGYASFSRNDTALYVSRTASDGSMVSFVQGGTEEGSISVSGTTISYNGAHLSRWSQLPSGQERTEILRGSVLSNINEMCEWSDEDNEQLNRMKVSDVEGDKNVSGVFQCWDDDDDTYTDDFYCAMTGDFIIRIADGVTVERGDLLMSAGDGTAKPQDDDIIRSKTVAKVTSTHVTCTYEDGSYCVPCVLMAC